MDCERVGDEGLQADKMDALYGEADAAVDRVCMHRPGRIAVAIVPGGRKGITLGRDGYIAFPQF